MQGMRDLLRGSLRRTLRDLSPLDRLSSAWPVACGSALAARGEIERLDEQGVVHVRVESAAWMQPFLGARLMLASELAKIAGVSISEIHFSLAANTQGHPAEGVRRTPGEKI